MLSEHLSREGAGHGNGLLVRNLTRQVELPGGARIDPNRMFSNEGAERNLYALNPGWNAARISSAVAFLGQHRHELINRLLPPKGGVLIALHNNSRGYNMKAEVEVSDAVAANEPDHPEDFGLCVDPADFEALRKGPYNFVLQAKPRGREDGSLSRLAARLNVRYVNLEAGLGNLEKQRAMLNWVEQTLA